MSTCLGFLLVECDGAASNSTPLSTLGKTKHYKADGAIAEFNAWCVCELPGSCPSKLGQFSEDD